MQFSNTFQVCNIYNVFGDIDQFDCNLHLIFREQAICYNLKGESILSPQWWRSERLLNHSHFLPFFMLLIFPFMSTQNVPFQHVLDYSTITLLAKAILGFCLFACFYFTFVTAVYFPKNILFNVDSCMLPLKKLKACPVYDCILTPKHELRI